MSAVHEDPTPRVRPSAAAALGIAAAAALFAALLTAPRAAPAPDRASAPPASPSPTPSAPWQPLVEFVVARALNGDALVLVERSARGTEGRAVARAVADAAAAVRGGPRLAIVDALPSTAAAAANRLAAALAAPRVWVAWPVTTAATALPTSDGMPSAVPVDDPLRVWLDGNGRAVDARIVGAGEAGWAVGAWEHVPSLDGGDYPPVVVPEPLGGLELVGWSIAPLPLRAGRAGRVRAAWKVGRDGAPGYRIAFRLVDGAGRVAADFDDPPANRLAPIDTWPEADITVVSHDFTVGEAVQAGAYDVAVNAVDPATGRAVEAGAGRVIGAVIVERP